MTFHDDAGAYWWADTVDELDYYFIHGGTFDGVTRRYHELTGKAPLLPKWAFGFVQSKERYVNADGVGRSRPRISPPQDPARLPSCSIGNRGRTAPAGGRSRSIPHVFPIRPP